MIGEAFNTNIQTIDTIQTNPSVHYVLCIRWKWCTICNMLSFVCRSLQCNWIAFTLLFTHTTEKKPFLLCTFMFLCSSEHWSNLIFRELSNSHSIHCIFASRTFFQLPFQCKYLYRLNFYSLFIKFLETTWSMHGELYNNISNNTSILALYCTECLIFNKNCC